MTYVLAWKTQTTVYISTDSAITKEGAVFQKWPTSTFEERHISEPGKTIEEGALKLFNILDKVLFAVAGDYNIGLEVSRAMYRELKINSAQDTLEAFRRVTASTLDDSNRLEVQIVIGYFDHQPRLIIYNQNWDAKTIECDSLVQLGSIHRKPELVESTREFIASLIGYSLTHQFKHYLIVVNSWVQSYGLHNVSMDIGVGGLIVGAQVDSNGVQWQGDSNCILCSGPELQMRKVITVLYRFGGVVFRSPLEKKAFIEVSPSESPDELEAKLKQFDDPKFAKEAEYFVFFFTHVQQVFIIPKYSNEKEKYLDFIINDNEVGILLNENLVNEFLISEAHLNFLG